MGATSEDFHALLEQIGDLHDKKQADYGKDGDPFANVRASEDFGIPAWVGALVRLNDKVKRLSKAAQGGDLANESVEDSFMDIAVYALIGLLLHRETLPPVLPAADVLRALAADEPLPAEFTVEGEMDVLRTIQDLLNQRHTDALNRALSERHPVVYGLDAVCDKGVIVNDYDARGKSPDLIINRPYVPEEDHTGDPKCVSSPPSPNASSTPGSTRTAATPSPTPSVETP